MLRQPATVQVPAGSRTDSAGRFLLEALARNAWNRTATAQELGIHKTTLHRRIRRLGIALPPVDGRSGRNRKRG